MQIQRNFPRVSKRISVNEFSQYFRGSLKSTSLFFLKHFKPKDEQTTSLFSLERYVFTYRQEILKNSKTVTTLSFLSFNKKKNKVIFVIRDTCNTKTFCGELHIYPLKTLLK